MTELFKVARKAKQDRAKIMLFGGPGAGKTYTGLIWGTYAAEREGGELVVIDTEYGRSRKYADEFHFRMAEITQDFSPARYIKLVEAAMKDFPVVLIDGLTPAWQGPGGVLEKVDKAGGGMKGWQVGTPQQRDLTNMILAAKSHIIATSRAKVDFVLDEVEEGKNRRTRVKQVSLKPDQREGLGYEFDFEGIMQTGALLRFDKSMIRSIYNVDIAQPDKAVMETILDWLQHGAEEAPAAWTYDPELIEKAAAYLAALKVPVEALEAALGTPWRETTLDRDQFKAFVENMR